MRLKAYAVVVTLLLVIALACGGGGTIGNTNDPGTPPSVAKVQQHFNYIPGFGGSTKVVNTKTTAFSFSLTPKAYAQTTTTTVSMTGNYNGFCETFYSDGRNPATVYGLGQYKGSANCNMDGSDQEILSNYGQLVVGDGTIKNLVFAAEAPTNIHALVTVYVNGQPSTLTADCVANENSKIRCANTTTQVAVKDGDDISAAVKFYYTSGMPPASPAAYKVRVFVGKE